MPIRVNIVMMVNVMQVHPTVQVLVLIVSIVIHVSYYTIRAPHVHQIHRVPIVRVSTHEHKQSLDYVLRMNLRTCSHNHVGQSVEEPESMMEQLMHLDQRIVPTWIVALPTPVMY
jgi:uncharacterized protein YybS (DUF2232 family)